MRSDALKAAATPDTATRLRSAGGALSLQLRAGPAALLVAALAFAYRFNAMGGSLGGFGNDHFITLARARQMLGGDLPYRDFLEPGAPLLSAMSAVGQWAFGYNLLAEALLSVGLLSLGAAMTVWLAARLTGRVWPAVLAALLQVGLAPRLYNYPKIVLPAAGIWLCWRYADRPATGRVVALACWLTIAFLFRHDFLIYFGILAILTIALANRAAPGTSARHTLTLGACSLGLVAPYLLFLHLSGGIPEYVRQAAAFTRADTERTSFHRPVFDTSGLIPVVSFAPGEALPPARVNVRWDPQLTDTERHLREQQYHLEQAERREGTTWNYALTDVSRRNIEALVRDSRVLDTHGIDRSSFTVSDSASRGNSRSLLSRLQIAPGLTRDQNLVAWLFYTLTALPLIAAIVWAIRVRSSAENRAFLEETVAYVWPVIVLSGLFAAGFLFRGTVNARLADVTVPAGLLTAWLFGGSPARPSASRRGQAVRLIGIVVLGLSVWSVTVLGAVRSTALRSKLESPAAMADRMSAVWQTLRRSPAVEALDSNAPISKAARYIDRCVPPDARVFILGNLPELYYFSGRMFAGGHSWLLPGYATSARDQQLTLERLRAYDLPLVLVEPEPLFSAEYVPDFPLLVEYLNRSYEEAGTLQVGEASRMRVFVSRRAEWSGRDAATGLPCGSMGL